MQKTWCYKSYFIGILLLLLLAVIISLQIFSVPDKLSCSPCLSVLYLPVYHHRTSAACITWNVGLYKYLFVVCLCLKYTQKRIDENL
jgi:hypothetical protein